MSVNDESWDRPTCEFCKKQIQYGKKSLHLEGKCLDNKHSDDETLNKITCIYCKEKISSGTAYCHLDGKCCHSDIPMTNNITSISEFERTKPVVTMKKLNDLIRRVKEEQIKTEMLYKDRVRSLDEIEKLLEDLKDSFKKGE